MSSLIMTRSITRLKHFTFSKSIICLRYLPEGISSSQLMLYLQVHDHMLPVYWQNHSSVLHRTLVQLQEADHPMISMFHTGYRGAGQGC